MKSGFVERYRKTFPMSLHCNGGTISRSKSRLDGSELLRKYISKLESIHSSSGEDAYFYNGSPERTAGEVLTATDSIPLAILSAAQWDPEDFDLSLGISNGSMRLTERSPGNFEKKLGVPGYVHYLDPSGFAPIRGALGGHAFKSLEPARVVRTRAFRSALDELNYRSDVQLKRAEPVRK